MALIHKLANDISSHFTNWIHNNALDILISSCESDTHVVQKQFADKDADQV